VTYDIVEPDDRALPTGARRLVIETHTYASVEGILADADKLVAPYLDRMEPTGRDQLRLLVIQLLGARNVSLTPVEQQSEILRAMPLPGGLIPGGGRIQ
jgi:hypothetical protein